MDTFELVKLFSDNKLKTKGGTFWFFNKYPFGKACDNFYKLTEISVDKIENKLFIQTAYPKLTIWNPRLITEIYGYSGYRINIKFCDKMLLEFEHDGKRNSVEYICKQNQIIVTTNNELFKTIENYNQMDNNVIEFGE